MSANFTKLFASLLSSSIWCEDAATKVVWVTLLAMADQHGEVEASLPGLARFAGVTLDEAKDALEVFLAPDEYSRTEAHEGRRIEKIPGGFRLINHAYYRQLGSSEQKKAADRERQRRHREAQKDEPAPAPTKPEHNAPVEPEHKPKRPAKTKRVAITARQAQDIARQHPIVGRVKGAPEAVAAWQSELEQARKLWATPAALCKHLDNISQHPPEVALLAIEYAAANRHTTIAGGLKEALAQRPGRNERKRPQTNLRVDGTRPGEYPEQPAQTWNVG